MKRHIVIFCYSVIVLVLLAVFMPSDILMSGSITGSSYLDSIPYKSIDAFGGFIFIKPSSTFFVYLLGVITMGIGGYFAKDKTLARKHWGVSLLLWGLGAILAGTSYQGFGYELKCVGNEFCSFTSWWELSYLYVTGLSITLMAVSVLFKTFGGHYKKVNVPIIGFFIYSFLLTIGAIFSIYFLITYEFFIMFFGIYFIALFIINVREFLNGGKQYHLKMIQIWIILMLVNVLYFVYLLFDITHTLYDRFGIWFSENDVLHIALIAWMILIWTSLKDEL